jgi:protein-tyrosine phosphatase
MKILFVCHGNINRSAAGEIILQKFKPDWEIKSAALKDTNGGEITAKKMRLALTEKGFPTDGIRSTPISKELVDWADVIFYMDDSNEKRLFSKFGVINFQIIY